MTQALQYNGVDLLCECGHPHTEHLRGHQGCLNEDDSCDCQRFVLQGHEPDIEAES